MLAEKRAGAPNGLAPTKALDSQPQWLPDTEDFRPELSISPDTVTVMPETSLSAWATMGLPEEIGNRSVLAEDDLRSVPFRKMVMIAKRQPGKSGKAGSRTSPQKRGTFGVLEFPGCYMSRRLVETRCDMTTGLAFDGT